MNSKLIRDWKLRIENSRRGFTLIELLITIFLVSIGLIGVISFFNSTFQSHFGTKNELVAAGLAQEGLELVRNIVDYQYLNGGIWYSEIVNKKDAADPNYCSSVDRDILFGAEKFKCRSKSKKDVVVCFDVNGGFYYQANSSGNCPQGAKTDFRRQLTISGYNLDGLGDIDLDAGDCLNVVATVGWPNSSAACAADIADCPYKTVSTEIICKPRQ